MKQKIKIDVVSDVVCPWCYIGKRRLENALQALSGQFEFDVQYHPFELNPGLPHQGVDHKNHLIEKFGSEDRYEELTARVTSVAADEGLEFDLFSQKISPNTRKMHSLIQFAQTRGVQKELVEIFFNAYFVSALDLSNEENLLKAAVEAGLDEDESREIIADKNRLQEVADREKELQGLGISGVPFFIINNKYAISGAQASSTFEKALSDIARQTVAEGETCDTESKNC